ncbi:hypothetical protein IscW_ISCW010156 [Ixodes scapularis]|uniref:Uncharacterized protein n=1 Tax=Ixodes scapularis TaxID=6945 RepID=B7Q0L6_IXOSC|nr:hypothetical protein IscW_ISCW010156 [Ixodes scapularis]|eukprot:XP_002407974.1 hypothetical protein IscW_ISCW010156 [Ixodes scapularis]
MTLETQHLAWADVLLHSPSRLPSLNVKPGTIAPRVSKRYSFANYAGDIRRSANRDQVVVL